MKTAFDPYSDWNGRVSGKLDLAMVGHTALGACNRVAYRPRVADAVALGLAGLQYPFEKLALSLCAHSPNLEIVVAHRAS